MSRLVLGLVSALIAGFGLDVLGRPTTTSSQKSWCYDYSSYSMSAQGKNMSTGPLALPFMRPPPHCRTFNSSAVERVIGDMKERLIDPDIARIFENAFPNTLDTTVKYYNSSQNLAFIITGDINAQWLRDTGNQFAQYHSLYGMDPELAGLVRAVINNEARYINQFPYCGAFQPPPESKLRPTANSWASGVTVQPRVNKTVVFECKFELDSLCSFIKLSRSYFESTHDASIVNKDWILAIMEIFRVIDEQSGSSFGENFRWYSPFNWTGGPGALSPAVNNLGHGEPRRYNGLVGTHHRPSDDRAIFPFLTPANAMLSVELGHLADMLDATEMGPALVGRARDYSNRIRDAIWNNTIHNGIFAYETNGMGSNYIMDDANVPSLLSLPYLGFLDASDPTYVATRKVLLSADNPYYSQGETFYGIGGPHIDAWDPWPMSLISGIFGSDNGEEILHALYTVVNNTAGLGLIHESVNIYEPHRYTRQWFAWANSYFAEMLLDLAWRKPHLIFKTDEPYTPGGFPPPRCTTLISQSIRNGQHHDDPPARKLCDRWAPAG